MSASATIALLGQPNSGKSTLFNALTGLRQHVGNWPGKTVEKKEGSFSYKGKEYKVSKYSIVFQDVTLFNNSVLENIRIGKSGATDEEDMTAYLHV